MHAVQLVSFLANGAPPCQGENDGRGNFDRAFPQRRTEAAHE